MIGLAYTTVAPTVCLIIGHFSSAQPERRNNVLRSAARRHRALDAAISRQLDLPLLRWRRGLGRGGRHAEKPILTLSAIAFVPLSPPTGREPPDLLMPLCGPEPRTPLPLGRGEGELPTARLEVYGQREAPQSQCQALSFACLLQTNSQPVRHSCILSLLCPTPKPVASCD